MSKTHYVVWVWSDMQGTWLRYYAVRQMARAVRVANEARAFWESVTVTRGEDCLVVSI